MTFFSKARGRDRTEIGCYELQEPQPLIPLAALNVPSCEEAPLCQGSQSGGAVSNLASFKVQALQEMLQMHPENPTKTKTRARCPCKS